VPIRIEHDVRPRIWLRTPPIEWKLEYDRAGCARALGIETSDLLELTPQILDAGGNPTLLVPVQDEAVVDRAWLDAQGLESIRGAHHEPMCVFVFAPTDSGAYSRMFAPEYGIIEDPATGSSTGPLAAYMMKHGLVSSAKGTQFFSEQGTKMGRRSILYVQIHGEQGAEGIDVGGYVSPVAEGTMTF
jgi:trans-2,3-dihydro-3-hydroxyanthranilate isomerase